MNRNEQLVYFAAVDVKFPSWFSIEEKQVVKSG
jgi:hypothetical protein